MDCAWHDSLWHYSLLQPDCVYAAAGCARGGGLIPTAAKIFPALPVSGVRITYSSPPRRTVTARTEDRSRMTSSHWIDSFAAASFCRSSAAR